MSSKPVTIFSETFKGLASALAEAAVDHDAFEKPLPVCELAKCRATCCHDGVILSAEEARVLSRDCKGISSELGLVVRVCRSTLSHFE